MPLIKKKSLIVIGLSFLVITGVMIATFVGLMIYLSLK